MRKIIAAIVALPLTLSGAEPVKIDSATIGGLEARSIGPSVMGGRISAIDAVAGSPSTIYVGAASGGVWKSSDSGTTFKPVFDEHPQSIGSIAIDQKNPKTVWVGTGESCVRNSVSIGNGVYRSIDGGDTWSHLGLAATERIAKVAVDSNNSEIAYVCGTGHAWNANEERGVFKTTDGGKSWKKVLYVDPNTGCSDLSIDPQDPKIMYAGMWDYRRQPDTFRSGGKGSGLYKSTDAGETWKRLSKGLPSTELGRIAVAVAPSRTSVVYALVESKETALYRSDDLGESWSRLNDSMNITARPFYFSHLAVDPTDFNRVYKPGLSLGISTDGGKTFTSAAGATHGDHHALWINPKDPTELMLGTDGGVYTSRDRGARWSFLNNFPVAQFYHVAVDDAVPYNVYGGLQDNGSWMAPSRAAGGIGNRHWRNIGGGDGFHVVPDPSNPDVVYAEWQGGNIFRLDRSTGETRNIKPLPSKDDPKFRFNWNTPIHASRKNRGTIYIGSQFLHRTSNGGVTWDRISPDLTTNDTKRQMQLESGGLSRDNTSAENYTTIFTINESPLDPNIIWVGTDDGNIQVTRDGGKSWSNVGRNLHGVPANTWVSTIEASHHDPAIAYATLDGHRTGDMKSYLYRTDDFGQSWTALATDDVKGFAHVIREDMVNRNLLFAGTELGLFISLDAGKSWAQHTEKFPRVPVNDIAIQSRESDVVIGTHGRGLYVIDDITPLRALDPQKLEAEVVMLPSRNAVMIIPSGEQRMEGDAEYSGQTTQEVATIHYYLKKRHMFGDSRFEIYDEGGKLVTTLAASKRRGINRVEWPMRLKAPRVPAANAISGGAFLGPRVPAGTYKIKYIKGKDTFESEVRLVADSRSSYTAEDRALQQKTVMHLHALLERLTFLVENIVSMRDKARGLAGNVREMKTIEEKLESMRKSLVATADGGVFAGEEQLREMLSELYGGVSGYDGRPTDGQIARAAILETQLVEAEKKFDAFVAKELASANRQATAKKLDPIKPLSKDEWEKKASGVGSGNSVTGKLPKSILAIINSWMM